MMLSIGIMMKNEEKYIKRCLDGLMPIVENLDAEIIIIDTGSTDKSIEIARNYTDKVYSHKWNNDFSEVRNKLISLSKGEWYLSVDADEILVNPDDIIQFFLSGEFKSYNGATVKIKSFSDSSKSKYSINDLNRIFKKDKDFKYLSTIHEQPTFKNPTKVLTSIFEHYGYLNDDRELMERKFQRNCELLKREVKKDPTNIYMNLQLGVTYSMHGDCEIALEILEKTYKRMNNNDKRVYKQLLIEYSNLLVANNRLTDVVNVCKEAVNLFKEDKQYKIDLLYNLANVSFAEKRYKNAIEYYNRYFDLVEKWEKGQLEPDNTITMYKACHKNRASIEFIAALYKIGDYNEAIEYSYKIDKESEFIICIKTIVDSFIKHNDFQWLYKYYVEKVLEMSEKVQFIFINEIEKQKRKLNSEGQKKLINVFKIDTTIYGDYNKIIYCEQTEKKIQEILYSISSLDLKEVNIGFFGEILYIALEKKYNIARLFNILPQNKILELIEYCNDTFKKSFLDLIADYLNLNNSNNFENIKIKMIFYKSILILDEKNEDEYIEIFNSYIKCGIFYLKTIYSEYVIENELVNEINNSEQEFLLYMLKADEIKNLDIKQYINYLKKALRAYPRMNKGIKQILKYEKNRFEENKSEMDLLKDKLIDNIRNLIDSERINEAKMIIEQFKIIAGEDIRIIELESKIS